MTPHGDRADFHDVGSLGYGQQVHGSCRLPHHLQRTPLHMRRKQLPLLITRSEVRLRAGVTIEQTWECYSS